MNEAIQALFPSLKLEEGETYAGIIIGQDGEDSYHLVTTSHSLEGATWQDAMDWAKSLGLELPTRRELRLQWVNDKVSFDLDDWYWSGETHASASSYAWGQGFLDGNQDTYDKTSEFRARAVRRLPI